jgi:hypothetical protein
MLWRHAAAIEDDGGCFPRRFRCGPPLADAMPTMRRSDELETMTRSGHASQIPPQHNHITQVALS